AGESQRDRILWRRGWRAGVEAQGRHPRRGQRTPRRRGSPPAAVVVAVLLDRATRAEAPARWAPFATHCRGRPHELSLRGARHSRPFQAVQQSLVDMDRELAAQRVGELLEALVALGLE